MTEVKMAAEKIFIIDDDASVRRSLARLLSTEDYSVEEFASGAEFLDRPVYSGKGCIILDVNMPDQDGMTLYDVILGRGVDLPVVFLTGHGDIPMSVAAMKKGASNFLTKPVDENILLTTVAEAINSFEDLYNRNKNNKTVQQHLITLTPRENDVLQYILAGKRNKEIATLLSISEKTVKVHRAHVMEKMHADSIADLVRDCVEAGVKQEIIDKS